MIAKNVEVPEVFPAITVDRAIGAHVEDIDIDYGRLTTMMRRHGLSDEAIADYSVHISAEEPKSSIGKPLDGKYEDQTMTIYATRRLKGSVQDLKSRGVIAGPAVFDISSKAVSQSLSRSLTHELEHGIIEYEGGMPEVQTHERKKWHGFLKRYAGAIACGEGLAFLGSGAAEQFGYGPGPTITTAYIGAIIGVALHDIYSLQTRNQVKSYLEHPAEHRARRSQLNTPDNLVSVQLKIDASLRSHLASEQ